MKGLTQTRMNTLRDRTTIGSNHTNQKKTNPRSLSPIPDREYLIRLAKKVPKVSVAPLKRINDHMKMLEEFEKQKEQQQ